MRYLSVCSGIEAATVAWHPLGWEPAAFSDIETFPRSVLRHHYPNVPLHGRERRKGESLEDYAADAGFQTIRGDEYGTIDLLVGGTPCQSFSVAGLRGGLADERGNLALEYLRLARRTGARWLAWENVPGVLSSNGGRDFGAIIGGMAELGYGFAYRVLDAQFFGVPQRRRRVFVVGHLGDWRRAAAVLFERYCLSGHSAPRREAGQIAPTIPSRGSAGGGLGTDFDCDGGLIEAFGGGNCSGPVEIATTLTTKNQRIDFEAETFIAHSLRGEGFDASEDGTGRGTPIIPVHAFGARQSDVIQYGDMTGPIDTDGYGIAIAFSAKDYGGDALEDCSPTLRAGSHAQSHANAGAMPAIAGGGQIGVRRLTPRECERLQGFPDDYTLIPGMSGWRDVGDDEDPAMLEQSGLKLRTTRKGQLRVNDPDGPRYRALGNSMAVPVMRWIGERIAAVEALEQPQELAA